MTIVLNGDTGITSPGGDTQAADTTINGVRVGRGAGAVSTNTAVGASALAANTSGAYNTAVGYQAGYTNTTTTGLTALGYQAGRLYNPGSDSYGSLFAGTLAGTANTTGVNNAFVGGYAGTSNTSGSFNSAVGSAVLYLNTTGSNNTAQGFQALYSNTTASNNTAVGYQALYSHVNSDANSQVTALGYKAGFLATGYNNTLIGGSAGLNATTGIKQTFVGYGAGADITTGSKNTILGTYGGNVGGLDIRTADNYIVLSDGDGNPRAWIGAGNNNDLFRVGTVSTDTSTFMHSIQYSQNSRYAINFSNTTSAANPNGVIIDYPNSNSTSGSDNLLYCGISTGQRASFRNNGGLANFQANDANLSDRREKTNFAPAKSYLDVICAIPIQTFNYVDQDLENDPGLTLGVVAQDVQAVAPEFVVESNWGTKEAPKVRLSIYQTDLQYALMKCIQELKAEFDAYKEAHP